MIMAIDCQYVNENKLPILTLIETVTNDSIRKHF